MEVSTLGPTKNPAEVYPVVPGIDYENFILKPERMDEQQRSTALKQLKEYETKQRDNFLGYQANQKLDFARDLSEYLDYHINNIGDPFVSGNFTVNSKFAERAVLDYFAALWHAQWPHESRPGDADESWKESYWGYVMSMGSTEANVYGLWNARDYLAGRFILVDPTSAASGAPRTMYYQAKITAEESPNAYTPIMFYSQDTHYSIVKASRVLSILTFNEAGSGVWDCPLRYPEDYPKGFSKQYLDENGWPLEVPSNEDGSICIPALEILVRFFAEKGYPILVNFNLGTTFKGGYDNVEAAAAALKPILVKNGLYERKVVYDHKTGRFDYRSGYWFHVDGALGAAYVPFLEMAHSEKRLPVFDFRVKEVHSISMSGHKWIGGPWPSGIYMTKTKYQLQPPDDPMYIGSPDSTFAGSRNGFSALILWDYFSRHSYKDLQDKALRLEQLSEYADNQLLKLQDEIGVDLWVERSDDSLTIRFRQPNPDIVFKYSLSGEELYVNGERRAYAHIFMMEWVTLELIDRFIQDLRASGAFPEQVQRSVAASNSILPTDARRGVYVPLSGRGFH